MPAKTKTRKTVKKSKSRSGLSGAFSRLSRPGKILTVLVILLLVSLAGTYGYSKWKPDDVAKAGSYATIYNSSGYRILACQRSMGNIPSISVLFAKPKSQAATANLTSFTSSKIIYSRSSQSSWWNQDFTHIEIPAPRNGWYDASIAYKTSGGSSYRRGPGLVAMPFTPPCPGFE